MSTYRVRAVIFRLDEQQRAQAEIDAKAAGCSVNELGRRRFVGMAPTRAAGPAPARRGELQVEREIDPLTGRPA